MSILQTLKNTFLPSEEESAKRRLQTFGSESKFGAGVKIGAIATTAIVAPVLATSASARATVGSAITSVVKNLGSSFAKSSLGTKIGVVASAPIVAGYVASNPSKTINSVIEYPEKGANFGGNLQKFQENPTKENAFKIVEDNPVIATVTGGALAYLGGRTVLNAGAGALALYNQKQNTDATRENTKAINESIVLGGGSGFIPESPPKSTNKGGFLSDSQMKSASAGNSPPILDEANTSSQVPEATVPAGVPKKERAISNRIQIINQSKASISANNRKIYIHKRHRSR